MTTHGRGELARAWLGSVADEFIQRAPCPVFLTHACADAADLAQRPTFKHILIPLDGSAVAEQIVEPAVALGGVADADFTLLRVIQPATLVSGELIVNPLPETSRWVLENLRAMDKDLQGRAETYVQQVADRLRTRSLRVQISVVHGDRPAEAILDFANRTPVDLIALGTHCRRGLARLFLGSVTHKVLRGADPRVG